jgi:hypothetical protein
MLPLVWRIERRLVSTSSFLNQVGRLKMVNLVLSALPIFFMSNIKLPPTIINMVEKYRKHYFWRGSDLNDKKNTPSSLEQDQKMKGDWVFLTSRLKTMLCY